MPLDASDLTRLRDMVTWSRKAIHILGKLSYDEMMADEAKPLALARCVEIVGEAAHHVSAAVKSDVKTVPWPIMYGMRNRLIHDYGNTDYEIVYNVVSNNLPGLVETIAAYLAAQGHPL